jgi:predicted phage gp36 major capsid-like protein
MSSTSSMVTLLRSALIFERSAHRGALFLQRTGLNLSGGDGQDAGDTKELNGALRTLLRGDDRALKAMSVGSDPDGGFTVIPQLASAIHSVEEPI